MIGKILGFVGLGGGSTLLWIGGAAIVAAVGATIGLLYLQNQNLRAENDVLNKEAATLELALDQQKRAVEDAVEAANEWRAFAARSERALEALRQLQYAAEDEIRRLRDEFDQPDNTPEAIAADTAGAERRANANLARVFSLLEQSTDVGDPDDGGGRPEAPASGGATVP